MQVDEATRKRYEDEAPELLDFIEAAQESPWIMRKNSAGFCVKLEDGLCGIHKKYGDRFLGDACHFYPRVTRALGSQIMMTASMSCPEIARIALLEDALFQMNDAQVDRLPSVLKNYLPDGMSENDAFMIHQAFLSAAADGASSAEHLFLRIASASRSLERIDMKSWPAMTPYYLQHADERIPTPEKNINDPFNLLHALCGLIVASHKPPSARLRAVIDAMEMALSVRLDWDKVQIHADEKSLHSYHQLREEWNNKNASLVAPMLQRWLQMQMSLALFPFNGLGKTLSERITMIGVRLAIIRLAILCNCSMHKEESLQTVVVRVVQSVSRFLDHLGSSEFSMEIFTETGWVRESRMCGLLENEKNNKKINS